MHGEHNFRANFFHKIIRRPVIFVFQPQIHRNKRHIYPAPFQLVDFFCVASGNVTVESIALAVPVPPVQVARVIYVPAVHLHKERNTLVIRTQCFNVNPCKIIGCVRLYHQLLPLKVRPRAYIPGEYIAHAALPRPVQYTAVKMVLMEMGNKY